MLAPTADITCNLPNNCQGANVTISNLDFKNNDNSGTIKIYYKGVWDNSWVMKYKYVSTSVTSIVYGLSGGNQDDYYIKVELDNGNTTVYDSGDLRGCIP